MSLFFRMLWVVLAALRRPRLGPLDESVVRLRVLPTDLDLNLHLNNGRYLTLMDLGRVDLLIRSGVVGVMRRRRWGGVVASVLTRFRRPLGPLARFELRTRLLCWDDRWIFLEQRFTRAGQVMAYAYVKIQLTSRAGRVSPAQVAEAMGWEIPDAPVPQAVLEWQAAEDALVAGPVPAEAVA